MCVWRARARVCACACIGMCMSAGVGGWVGGAWVNRFEHGYDCILHYTNT